MSELDIDHVTLNLFHDQVLLSSTPAFTGIKYNARALLRVSVYQPAELSTSLQTPVSVENLKAGRRSGIAFSSGVQTYGSSLPLLERRICVCAALEPSLVHVLEVELSILD